MICCLFRYSTDAGTSSCLWNFNPLLLRLLGEISLSLLCLHSSRGSALDLDPPLHVGGLRASVLRSHRTGLKEQLLRGLWLTQAGGGGNVAGFFRLFPRTLPVTGKVTAITVDGAVNGMGRRGRPLTFPVFSCCGQCDAQLS